MRRLLLLRHAKSDWPVDTEDALRPLSERGRRDAPAMGKAIVREGYIPGLAMISTALRTRQTWSLLSPMLEQDVAMSEEPGLYGASEQMLLDFTRKTQDAVETLLICAHNPGIERLARSFAKSGDSDAIRRLERKYPTCGLAVIELPIHGWKDAAPPAGRLERFLTPASLSG